VSLRNQLPDKKLATKNDFNVFKNMPENLASFARKLHCDQLKALLTVFKT